MCKSIAMQSLLSDMALNDVREVKIDLVGAAPVDAARMTIARIGRLQGKRFQTRYNSRTSVLTIVLVEVYDVQPS